MATTVVNAEVDLLGEPRLKNGLTYYPGVQTEKGSVILGNVVRLQLQADSVPYIGYGFLKGLWLWRDQPYIRVQYMAPASMDLPKDAIAYRAEPDPSSMAELMVTNRVGDLHLNALLGPVFVEGGPLLSQLFQENVGPDSDGFICSRHLDPAVQRVQPLDDAFRLTPIVQAFPKTVLRAMLPDSGVSEVRVPACASQPQAVAAPSTAPPTSVPPAADTIAMGAAPAAPPPPPEAASRPADPAPDAPFTPPPMQSAIEPQPHILQGAPEALSVTVGPSSSVDVEVPRDLEVPDEERRAGMSPGLGPKNGPGKAAILLQATYKGLLLRRTMTVRCPVDAMVLRKRLARIFDLVAESVEIAYQGEQREWRKLSDTSELLNALERQPNLKALPVSVSGEQSLHLPFLHIVVSLIAAANLICSVLFATFVLWLAEPQPQAPFIYAIAMPPLVVVLHAYAASVAFSDEYLTNQPVRTAFSRIDGTIVAIMLSALLGPDTLVLLCRVRLPTFGASLSAECEQQLLWWAMGLHALQDVPMLVFNVLLHLRLELPYDPYSKAMLAVSISSLTIGLVWHVLRIGRVTAASTDGLSIGEGKMGTPSPGSRRQKSRRSIDTSKCTQPRAPSTSTLILTPTLTLP